MMNMRSFYVLFLPLLFACGADSSHDPEHEPPPSLTEAQAAHLDAIVENFVIAEGFPNLAIGVVQGGHLVWHAGFGTGAQPETPPDEDTLFAIGSVTKVFTGTALLSLVEDGVLDLDDEVAAWVPEIRAVQSPKGSEPITLRQLLNHSSGLPRDSSLQTSRDVTITEEALVASLAWEALVFAPGTSQSYSNLGVSLAGVVISRASGQPYQSFVQERIFAPLGMHASVFDTPVSGAAPGHYPHPLGGYYPLNEMTRLGAIAPAGGIYSSVKDLVGLVRHGLGQASILSPHMLAESQRPLRLNPREYSYGLGWLIDDHPELGVVVWHGGSTLHYGAHVGVLPAHDLGIIVLSGTATYGDFAEIRSLGDAVLAYLVNPETQKVPEKSTTPPAIQKSAGDRLLAFMADRTPESAEETFTPHYLGLLPADEIILRFDQAAASTGACSSWEVSEDRGVGAMLLVFDCEYGDFPVFVVADYAAPFLIGGLYF